MSDKTLIEWRIMGNPVLSGEATPETILTIHPDGRVTTSDRLKPTEAAALVLDQIKTHWMRDSQATTIRELQERIKRLEEALKCLTLVVGLTPIAGNKNALQEAMDIAIAELQAKEDKP